MRPISGVGISRGSRCGCVLRRERISGRQLCHSLCASLVRPIFGERSRGAKADRPKVTCSLHGATYDITTGNVLGPPAPEGVVSYKVQIDGNDIKVELP